MNRWMPDRKVWSGGLAAIAGWLLTLAMQKLFDIVVPVELGAAVVGIAGSSVAYLVPPSVADLVRRADDTLRHLGETS